MFNPYLFWIHFLWEMTKPSDQNSEFTRIVNKWDMKNDEASTE